MQQFSAAIAVITVLVPLHVRGSEVAATRPSATTTAANADGELAGQILKLQQRGDWDKAIASCYEAMAIHPGDPNARFYLASSLAGQGNGADAIRIYQELLAEGYRVSVVHNNIGLLLEQVGDNAGAKIHYETALKSAPDDEAPGINLAMLYFKSGDSNSAITRLQSVIAKHSDSYGAYANAALVYSKSGDPSQARNMAEQAVRVAPARADAHYLLGNICEHLGDRRTAGDEYHKALELNPKYEMARNALSRIRLGG